MQTTFLYVPYKGPKMHRYVSLHNCNNRAEKEEIFDDERSDDDVHDDKD